jgi:GWxTD domain-containing protein
MRAFSLAVGFVLAQCVWAQPVASTNINHLYNPNCEVQVRMQLVRGPSDMRVLFSVENISNVSGVDVFQLRWEKRENFTDAAGEAIVPEGTERISTQKMTGSFLFAMPEKPWLLLLTVTNSANRKTYLFPKLIDPKYPVMGVMEQNGRPVLEPYISKNELVTYRSEARQGRARAYFYRQQFEPASPPFAEKELRVDPLLVADSIFWFPANEPLSLKSEGLYLLQEDTTAIEGVAFRVGSEAYPRISRLDELAPPLVFLTTRDEFDRLEKAAGNKLEFDKIILEITRDKERAKTFMRNYYRRVELANQYFTSYKEGWKTDRGMVFMIFGLPDELTYTGSTEVWSYSAFGRRFSFVKRGSIYSPDHFVLARNRQYADVWFSTIDLWRKGRF